jgi:hypothetical protein
LVNDRTLSLKERREPISSATAGPPRLTVAQRLLRSPVIDLLLGPHGVDRYLELIHPRRTVTEHPGGLVSPYLIRHARPGMLLHLGAAQGEFTLP